MAVGWRIVKEKHSGSAFSGEGARLFGGRWNSPGTSLVYTSSTQSLAALETLVHLNPPILFRYLAFRFEFDDSLSEQIPTAELADDWRTEPPAPSTMVLGDGWVRAGRTAVLIVPSVILTSETNFLLNPRHPEFRRIKIGSPEPFAFDPRLLP